MPWHQNTIILMKKCMLTMITAALLLSSCGDDDSDASITPMAGSLMGGPFYFAVDGSADNVEGISVGESEGTNTSFIITDEELTILGLPGTLNDLEGVNFDGAGTGVCLIWWIAYEDDLTGLTEGSNAGDLMGSFDLSNSISVTRGSAGTLSGGPFSFTVDGVADNVSGIEVADSFDFANTGYVITDDAGNILGLPPTLEDVEGINFDDAGTGVCLIWRITYTDDVMGLMEGENTSGLSGTFSLSNAVTVNRQ